MSDLPVIDVAPPAPVNDAPVLAPGDSAVARQPGDDETEQAEQPGGESATESPETRLKRLERELERTKRKLNTVHGQRQEARETARRLEAQIRLQHQAIGDTNQPSTDDSDVVSVPRSQIDRLVEQRARQLAPSIRDELDLDARRRSAANTLRDELGQDRFDELANDVADFLPDEGAQLLILESDNPRALLEYLADPENEAEVKAFRRLSPYQQGLKLGQLSAQLKAKRSRDKPLPSKAPAPIEPVKSQGDASRKPLALLEGDDYRQRRMAQRQSRL